MRRSHQSVHVSQLHPVRLRVVSRFNTALTWVQPPSISLSSPFEQCDFPDETLLRKDWRLAVETRRKHPRVTADGRLNQTKEEKKGGKRSESASALVLRARACDLAVHQEQVWWSLVGSSHRTIRGRLRCDNHERRMKNTSVCEKRATAGNSTALKKRAGVLAAVYTGSLRDPPPPLKR